VGDNLKEETFVSLNGETVFRVKGKAIRLVTAQQTKDTIQTAFVLLACYICVFID